MDITELPIGPNSGQQNMDKVGANINDMVREAMGVLPDTGSEGREFLKSPGSSIFGYDGVVVRDGKIVSLVSLKADESVPSVSLGTELIIEGDSRGYVPSGHKSGDNVKVIGFIEPFFQARPGIQSSDRIIQVEGSGIVGWIKPSNFDKQTLKKQRDEEVQKLFDTNKEE